MVEHKGNINVTIQHQCNNIVTLMEKHIAATAARKSVTNYLIATQIFAQIKLGGVSDKEKT